MSFFFKVLSISVFIAVLAAGFFHVEKKRELKKTTKTIVTATSTVTRSTESLNNKKKEAPLPHATKKENTAPASRRILQNPSTLPEKTLPLVPISVPVVISSHSIVPPVSPLASSSTPKMASSSPTVLSSPTLPLDEAMLLAAVVKIECATKDGLGKYVGSGFVMNNNRVVTAAHLVKDSGSDWCRVIFPHERRPIYYLKGNIENLKDITPRHDEEGIDVALLKLPLIAEYDDAHTIFPDGYPFISYPLCTNSHMLGDTLLHFGYSSSFLDQNYLSESKGEVVLYADIKGIKDQISLDGSSTFKSPIFDYTQDETTLHPYMVSRVPIFYGDSGGLAFNVTKQCILGPHRGGTIGGGAGENYSVFPLLGWGEVPALLQKN